MVPVPTGNDDPLGVSVADPQRSPLRLFEPRDVRLVIGRSQDPTRELDWRRAAADGVPIHRRPTGGGAVVLAPGTLVVAFRAPSWAISIEACFARINQAMIPVVATSTGVEPVACGHGDLAMPMASGPPRKILGASLRRRRDATIYLGVFLIDDLIAQMEWYLASPSREPAYRAGRDHRAFCTHLGRWGMRASALATGLRPVLTALVRKHCELHREKP